MSDDSQQISVADLLKRNGQRVEARGGRRRRGVAGGISVAELTGEIPLVRDPSESRALDPDRASDVVDEHAPESEPVQALTERTVPADEQTAAFSAPFDDTSDDDASDDDTSDDDTSDDDTSDRDTADGDDADEDEEPIASRTLGRNRTVVTSPAGATSRDHQGAWVSRSVTRDKLVSQPVSPSTETTPTVSAPARSTPTVTASTVTAAAVTASTVSASTVSAPELEPTVAASRVELGVEVKPEPGLLSGSTLAGDLMRQSQETETDKSEKPRRSRRADRAEKHEETSGNSIRQWAVLLSQGVLAVIAGALLFKGFEKLWDVFPWIALILALLVILGLVAMVRILRRTDDITSFAIAVVVGMIVTLGPLAFILASG